MTTTKINEKSLLIVFEKNELSKYLPNGKFDVSDPKSRKSLRSMLSEAVGSARKREWQKVKLEMFGSADTEVNIFCTFCEYDADSFT